MGAKRQASLAQPAGAHLILLDYQHPLLIGCPKINSVRMAHSDLTRLQRKETGWAICLVPPRPGINSRSSPSRYEFCIR